MATALSGVTPTWVIPLEPQFATTITPAESQKKNYANLSGSTPVYQWHLKWESLTDAKFWTLHAHYVTCKGGYDYFAWKDVPSYIDANHDGTVDGADVTVRYVAGSFKFDPLPHSWKAEAIFEERVI